jgi:hypothetical protein
MTKLSILLTVNWDYYLKNLNTTSNIIGLLTFFVSILIWLRVKHEQKKLKKLIYSLVPIQGYSTFYEEFTKIKTDNSAALCISLLIGTDSIKKTVKDFLEANSLQVKIIEEVKMDGINSPEDIEKYINSLREMRKGPLADATELRLFIAGPVQAGTIAGAIFDNWKPVLLYHKGKITYEYWGPLVKN